MHLKCSISNYYKSLPGNRIVLQPTATHAKMTFGPGGIILEYNRHEAKKKKTKGKRVQVCYQWWDAKWNIPDQTKVKGQSPGPQTLSVLAVLPVFGKIEMDQLWLRFNRAEMARQKAKWQLPEKLVKMYPFYEEERKAMAEKEQGKIEVYRLSTASD